MAVATAGAGFLGTGAGTWDSLLATVAAAVAGNLAVATAGTGFLETGTGAGVGGFKSWHGGLWTSRIKFLRQVHTRPLWCTCPRVRGTSSWHAPSLLRWRFDDQRFSCL